MLKQRFSSQETSLLFHLPPSPKKYSLLKLIHDTIWRKKKYTLKTHSETIENYIFLPACFPLLHLNPLSPCNLLLIHFPPPSLPPWPSYFYNTVKYYLPNAQVVPSKPGLHTQINPLAWSTHCPFGKQGLVPQLLDSGTKEIKRMRIFVLTMNITSYKKSSCKTASQITLTFYFYFCL